MFTNGLDLIMNIIFIAFCGYVFFDIFSRYVFVKEGMESSDGGYQEYDANTQVQVNKNTANIEFLKGQVDSLNQNSTSINTTVSNLTSQVNTLQDQIQNLTNAQQAYLQPEIANQEPGIDEDEEEEDMTDDSLLIDQEQPTATATTTTTTTST
jgi:hypothetical protein